MDYQNLIMKPCFFDDVLVVDIVHCCMNICLGKVRYSSNNVLFSGEPGCFPSLTYLFFSRGS